MSEFFEIGLLTFKDSPSAPPPAFLSASTELRSVPGVLAIYLGEHLETPGRFSWAVRWDSSASFDAFHASPTFPAWAGFFVSSLATLSILKTTLVPGGNIAAALEAPCTEVFSAFGADGDFLEKGMVPFSQAITKDNLLQGFHGLACGQFEAGFQLATEAPEANAVLLILGWDSKEAHLAERGEGKLIDNSLPLVKDGHKSTDMYHAQFKKL